MIFLPLIAATFTFSATATGVEKGGVAEFFLVGKGSDRDYEAVFQLDGSVDEFCRGLESAGFLRGKPECNRTCTLWPIGCTVTLKPALDEFVECKLPEGVLSAPIIYTGGTRLANGVCEAETNMPLSVFAFYSLAQSPFVFGAHYDQGAVYNCFFTKKSLAKGTRVEFTLSLDEKSMPKPLSYTIRPGQASEALQAMKKASENGEIDVRVDFDPELTVAEAKTVANALAVIDSPRVKINGCADGRLFYRAFMPLVKWQDRQERLLQPFELTVGATNELVYIESDWKVEGLDPRLIPHAIPFTDAKSHKDVDTCFIYAHPKTKLEKIYAAMNQLKDSSVRTWYVYERE